MWVSRLATTRRKRKEKKGFTIVSLDESYFFYDSLVRRVWIVERIKYHYSSTGSHQHSCVFGAVGIEEEKRIRRSISSYSDSTMYSMEIHSSILKENIC